VAASRVWCCSRSGWTSRRFRPSSSWLLVAYMRSGRRWAHTATSSWGDRREKRSRESSAVCGGSISPTRRRTVAFSMIKDKEASPRVCLLHDLECDNHGSWMLRFYKWDANCSAKET
jgi:hypothetical protein